VRLRFEARLDQAHECNCSICHQRGALWFPLKPEALEVQAREGDLNTYQFGTHTAEHYFCRVCGIHPFVKPRIAPHLRMVNLRCVEGVDVAALPRRYFDGRHFEAAAQALQAEIAAQRATPG
jgi:hypothetical protein